MKPYKASYNQFMMLYRAPYKYNYLILIDYFKPLNPPLKSLDYTVKFEQRKMLTTLNEHDFGWDDALSDLNKWFYGVFAKLENNNTGLNLYFKLKKTIKAPREKVFAAVSEHKQLNQYFAANSTTDFKEGNKVDWNFKNHPQFLLDVRQAIPNEMISFQWGDSTVCISFRDKATDSTEIVIEATGWKADQKGLEHSYSECEGWQNFLDLLAVYLQGKV